MRENAEWFDALTDEIEWNIPFSFRGKRMLLLSLAKSGRTNHLVIAYERDPAVKVRQRNTRRIRTNFAIEHQNAKHYFAKRLHILNTDIPIPGGVICTIFEKYMHPSYILNNIFYRLEVNGTFPVISPYSINIARYEFDADIDYEAIRKEQTPSLALYFPETTTEDILEIPFVLPLATQGEIRIPYTEPLTRKESEAVITRVILLDLSNEDDRLSLPRYLRAAGKIQEDENRESTIERTQESILLTAPPDHKLVFVEYTCNPVNELSFYTDHYLYGEMGTDRFSPNPKLAKINVNPVHFTNTFSGHGTCCIGFVHNDQSNVPARLFHCFYRFPEETVEIKTERTSNVDKYNNA